MKHETETKTMRQGMRLPCTSDNHERELIQMIGYNINKTNYLLGYKTIYYIRL